MTAKSTLEQEYRAISREYEALSDILTSVKEIRVDLMRSLRALHEKKISSQEFGYKLDDIELRLEDVERAEMKVNLIRYHPEDYGDFALTRKNNVVIEGVPQADGEDLDKIISKLARFARLPLDKREILRVMRKTSRDVTQFNPIIIVFRYRDMKKEFLASMKSACSLVPLTPRFIGLPGDHKIIISDHLTKEKKLLFKKAKRIAARRKYTYVWVRNGKLFMRKTKTSRIIQIKTEEDLDKIY